MAQMYTPELAMTANIALIHTFFIVILSANNHGIIFYSAATGRDANLTSAGCSGICESSTS